MQRAGAEWRQDGLRQENALHPSTVYICVDGKVVLTRDCQSLSVWMDRSTGPGISRAVLTPVPPRPTPSSSSTDPHVAASLSLYGGGGGPSSLWGGEAAAGVDNVCFRDNPGAADRS